MSRWENVSLCDICWVTLHQDREPVRVNDPRYEMCHKCKRSHRSGIYVRVEIDERIFVLDLEMDGLGEEEIPYMLRKAAAEIEKLGVDSRYIYWGDQTAGSYGWKP